MILHNVKKMILLNIRKKLNKESLARARKRIRSGIQRDNYTRMMLCIMRDGFYGHKRDLNVYKVN